MKTKFNKRYLALFLSLILSLEIISSYHLTAFAEQNNKYHKMTISLSLNKGGLFARYDVDVYFGTVKLCTIKCGQTYSSFVEVKEGSHVLWFYKKGGEDLLAYKTLRIKEDCDVSITMTDQQDSILIDNSSLVAGINKSISKNEKPQRIDTYCFEYYGTASSTSTLRASWSTYYYYDLVNGIVICGMTTKDRGKTDKRIYPYKVSVEDGTIIRRINEDGSLSSSYDEIRYWRSIVHYNENGEKTAEYKIYPIGEPFPKTPKDLGFFDSYPTPSDFLNSKISD